MRVNELRDFTYENYFKWVGFNKETVAIHWNVREKKDLLSFPTKLMEKIPNSSNTNIYHQSY